MCEAADDHPNDFLSPEHPQSNLAHEDWISYCVQVQVTLGQGRGDQPPPSHAWDWFINCHHVPGWP